MSSIELIDIAGLSENREDHLVSLLGALFESFGGSVGGLQYRFDPGSSPFDNLELLCDKLFNICGTEYLGSVASEDLQKCLSASPVLGTEETYPFVGQLQWRCSIVLNHDQWHQQCDFCGFSESSCSCDIFDPPVDKEVSQRSNNATLRVGVSGEHLQGHAQSKGP